MNEEHDDFDAFRGFICCMAIGLTLQWIFAVFIFVGGQP